MEIINSPAPEVLPAEPITKPAPTTIPRPDEDDPFNVPAPLINPTPKAFSLSPKENKFSGFLFFKNTALYNKQVKKQK